MPYTLKEIKELVTDKKAGARGSQYRTLHSNQEEDQKFFDLKIDIEVQKQFQKIKLPTARDLLDDFISHLPLINPVVKVIPFKSTEVYEERAIKQGTFHTALLHHSMAQTDNFIVDGGKSIGGRGEAFFKLVVDAEALKTKENEKEEDKEARLMERIPFKLTSPEPMNCFPHADHIDCQPVDIVEIYSVLAEQVRRVWPDWKSGKSNSKLVIFSEFWSDKQKCFLADGNPITDGVEDNPLGFMPYTHVYSGLGMRDKDNTPESKAVSLIRFLHDVLKQECRLHSYLDQAEYWASMPLFDLPGTKEDWMQGGKELRPHPGMVTYRADYEQPAKVTWAASEIPAGILNAIGVYENFFAKKRARIPSGVRAGYPMEVIIREAGLIFDILQWNLQIGIARALELVRLLIRDVMDEPISLWGGNKAVTLKPEDCKGAYQVKVSFESTSMETKVNQAMGLDKLRSAGGISLQTELKLNPLIEDPKKEMTRMNAESLLKHPVLQRQVAVKAWEALYGAKEALAVEQAMIEGEAGAMRKAESSGVPVGGKPESEIPEDILEQAIRSRRGKGQRGEK